MKDYTTVTERTYTDENLISLADDDAAIVIRADGELSLHLPGPMDAESPTSHRLAMLVGILLSGKEDVRPHYEALEEIQGQLLECASAPDDIVN